MSDFVSYFSCTLILQPPWALVQVLPPLPLLTRAILLSCLMELASTSTVGSTHPGDVDELPSIAGIYWKVSWKTEGGMSPSEGRRHPIQPSLLRCRLQEFGATWCRFRGLEWTSCPALCSQDTCGSSVKQVEDAIGNLSLGDFCEDFMWFTMMPMPADLSISSSR